MKKTYISPRAEVVQLSSDCAILSTSGSAPAKEIRFSSETMNYEVSSASDIW